MRSGNSPPIWRTSLLRRRFLRSTRNLEKTAGWDHESPKRVLSTPSSTKLVGEQDPLPVCLTPHSCGVFYFEKKVNFAKAKFTFFLIIHHLSHSLHFTPYSLLLIPYLHS